MYTVKEASKILNMSEHTIRYYTDCELIPTLIRTKNNQRLFNQDSMNWLLGIKNLKACGLSIKEIKEFVQLSQLGDSTIKERHQIFLRSKKLAELQLAEAQARVTFLENKLRHYEEIMYNGIPDKTNPSQWKR
ncbi:hypothetical protein DOK78_001451 [Enterococcus sp. DIV2402]|uniref:HTH merR-type domain-containing protein n=1 Tax=Candidatus Enterococcus lowellii TaxID=2230877 RepID=A0ABZ2SLV2_9ENTE|nr:MerR family transcriptional regulator [Enterococcus sp. DIV2402]MBO0464359.1 MerR family transcriptional regulator [Enterococcus sp. DIV2402]